MTKPRLSVSLFGHNVRLMKAKPFILALALVLGLCLRLQAMDRWAALSQVESGENDRAVGRAGEVSRYQMKPEVWRRFAPPSASWGKAEDSLSVAKAVMQERCVEFERSNHRQPTDFEFYILWNAPAQIQRRSDAVCERAARFCNLVASR